MNDHIDYWDEVEGKQKQRPCTQVEQDEINALRSIPAVLLTPMYVSRKAARLALLNAEKFHLVQPTIDALDDPDRTYAQIEWDDSMTFQRDSPTLLMIAGAIGLSADDLDSLFIAAAALE